ETTDYFLADYSTLLKLKAPTWTRHDLQEAIEAVVTQKMRFTQASTKYGIPKGTLYDNILGKTKRMMVLEEAGLNSSEETAVLEFCCDISVSPYNRRTKKSLNAILNFVEKLRRKRDPNFVFNGLSGFRWWWAFCKKHSIVSLYFNDENENDHYQYQLQSMWQKCWNTNQSLVHNLRFRERGPLKSWRPETMAEAIFSVLKEGLSLSQAARSSSKGQRQTAKDPAGCLAGRAHSRCDSSGGVPRRAFAAYGEGRANFDVPEFGKLRGVQRPRRRGQPRSCSRGRGCCGRSRAAASDVQHGGGGALAAARHDGDQPVDEPVGEPVDQPLVESAGSYAGQPASSQQQQQRRPGDRQQQWERDHGRRKQRQLAVESRPGQSGIWRPAGEPDGEPVGESARPSHGPWPHTQQRGGRHRCQRHDLQARAELRQPAAGESLPGGHRGSREEPSRAQGQGQDPRQAGAANGLALRI
ncbi:unnamed protein product, partial [Heterotrigona itama]